MANSKTYAVQFRRKRLGLTNYHRRLKLLASGKPRLVIRLSNKQVMAQVIAYSPTGDKVLATAESTDLRKFEWKYNLNLATSYLTGLLLGVRATKLGIGEAVLDIGNQPSTPGGRIYSCLKGVLDAKLSVPASADIFPPEDRIKGKHLAQYALLLKKQGTYESRFSEYAKKGANPENIPLDFEKSKNAILRNHNEKNDKP